jgi:hypothetical protein
MLSSIVTKLSGSASKTGSAAVHSMTADYITSNGWKAAGSRKGAPLPDQYGESACRGSYAMR